MKLRWIKEWDNNSRFFHILVNNRRNKNTISRLEREDGTVLEDKQEIEEEITSFYETLFKENNEITWSLQGLQWDAITRDKAEWLERRFGVEEIRVAVFNCDKDKSPGSDGYTMAFYQDCWDIISEDLVRFFEKFFTRGVVNSTMNHTILCLIPKKVESKYVKDFKPINLVSSVYKILTKVLTNRLRKVIGDTISLSQGAFIKDRQILDVVLVANEVVEEYRAKKKQGLVFKVDFEKAYDHVR